MNVEPVSLGSIVFETETPQYYLALIVLVLIILGAKNLMRSPSGLAWIAIRDSEVAAQAVGVNLAKFKTMAFAGQRCIYRHRRGGSTLTNCSI